MGLSVSVCLVRGIDYGTRREGDAAAWGWYDRTDDASADGCEAFTPFGADEATAHLVVLAESSGIDLDDAPSPVVDVLAHITRADFVGVDSVLRAFCAARGLPWREPRWLLLTDQS